MTIIACVKLPSPIYNTQGTIQVQMFDNFLEGSDL